MWLWLGPGSSVWRTPITWPVAGCASVVFEHASALNEGASVRNFGMILAHRPTSEGRCIQMGRRSRELWSEVLRASGLWHRECGSLHHLLS